MLRITRQADYGIVLLSTLARCPGRKAWTAAELSGESHIPVAMASKILKRLTREGILSSQRGVKGGYSLARTPESLTVVDMISALEGPVAMTECVDPTSECEQQCWCHLHPVWQQINGAILGSLRSITLADMTQPGGALSVVVGGTPGKRS